MSARDIDELLEGVRKGDRAALGRAITLIESTREADRAVAHELLGACLPRSKSTLRVGVTGVPGAGKSTFIEALGERILAEDDRRIAVLAVDPTSTRSGGSILGDKTRMHRLAADPRVFIRPSPSGPIAGGVARRTREALLVCEAAGYDTIFVETVGVGQAETAVHGMVDYFLLLVLAGAGDELQGIKRGIVEMADGIAVTKAEGDNRMAAEAARRAFHRALQLFPPMPSGWEPPVHTCSAMTGDGLDEIWDSVLEYERRTRSSGYFESRRRQQARNWLHETLDERLIAALHADPGVADVLTDYEVRVINGELTASAAADAILAAYRRLP